MPQPKLDTLEFSRAELKKHSQALGFRARTVAEAKAWQRKLRRKLIALLGGFPAKRVPLRPRIVETRRFKGYTRQAVYFETRDTLSAFAYFLVPDGFHSPGPAVLCLPGHGRGVDDLVGINEDGTMRDEFGGYQGDYALQCVSHGYAALAFEQLCFGHRRDEAALKGGSGNSSCQPASGAALLFGQTMIGWRVWDAMRAIDYLSTRPEVDPGRIATLGCSGGGTTSLHTAAIDERVKVAVVSCYFNTYADCIMSISHCMDNYIPGILDWAEMPDVAGLIAPRGFFAEGGTQDPIFPVAATRRAHRCTKRVYRLFGAERQIGLEIFDDTHRWWGKGAFEFLAKTL